MQVVLPQNLTKFKESFSADTQEQSRKMKKRFSEVQIVKPEYNKGVLNETITCIFYIYLYSLFSFFSKL